MKPCKCCIDCYALDGKRELCHKTGKWVNNYMPQGFTCPLDYIKVKKVHKKKVAEPVIEKIKRVRVKMEIPEKKLQGLYKSGLTMLEISKHFDTTESTIYQRMKQYGIERRSKSECQPKYRIKRLKRR